MPTQEWLKQHQKIQAYLNIDLFNKLSIWMRENNINQFSHAVVVILEHYLNGHPPTKISSQFLIDEIETLKKEITLIKSVLVEAGAKTLSETDKIELVSNSTEPEKLEYSLINMRANGGANKNCAL